VPYRRNLGYAGSGYSLNISRPGTGARRAAKMKQAEIFKRDQARLEISRFAKRTLQSNLATAYAEAAGGAGAARVRLAQVSRSCGGKVFCRF